MKTRFRPGDYSLSPLPAILLLAALSPACLLAQQMRGKVKSDSLPVYRQMSADSEQTGTLKRDDVVTINISITNDEGSWCGVSSIDPPAKLGYLLCNGLQRQLPAGAASGNYAAPQIDSGHMSADSRPTARAQQAWALAASALITELNHEGHDTLAGVAVNAHSQQCTRTSLMKWWDIHSREDLLRSLQWLEDGGHRKDFSHVGEHVSQIDEQQFKQIVAHLDPQTAHSFEVARRYYTQLGNTSLIGWDYARYISLCRWGYTAGFLSEDEAWARILPAARILQGSFGSWRELGDNYLIGRQFWSLQQTRIDGEAMHAADQRLLDNPSSPWNRIPWPLDLQ
jgi:hypothetical protein